MGKCILCVLIHAIFIFGIFIAFLIGHWISEGNKDGNSHNSTTPHFIFHRNLSVADIYPPVYDDPNGNLAFHKSDIQLSEEPIIPLPKYVLPVHYDLHLDFTEFSTGEHIYGNVSILFESFGNSTDDELIFHAASNIFIIRIRLHQDGRYIEIKSLKRQFNRDLARAELKERLRSTWYTLELEFRTRICQSPLEGVHCLMSQDIDYKNSTPAQRIIGFTTKFEPTFARAFLPCWDEPRIKTTFNISIKHQKSITVLANTAAQKLSPLELQLLENSSTIITRYAPTPRMPVYLLAFAIGNFIPLEMRTSRNMPITIWLAPEDIVAAQFAANFSPVMFDKVEEDFGVLYPLSKMDFVASHTFPVGGMENWGLVIYHAKTVLITSTYLEEQNMTVDRLFEQYKIEKIITHEIIHQWFGNLVTMYDWPDLWLSEGFASYFVYDFLNEDHPHLTDNEYYLRLIELLDKQTSNSRTPLVRRLDSANDIESMFDGHHLYTKGAVIVKMIKDLLGAFDFRAGITKFLKKNAFKSIDRANLWASLPAYADHGAENERLSDVMETWLLNEGMPEVILSRNYEDHTIRITQRVCDKNRYIIYLNEPDIIEPNDENSKRAQKRQIQNTTNLQTPEIFTTLSFETMPPVLRQEPQESSFAENIKDIEEEVQPTTTTPTTTPGATIFLEPIPHHRHHKNHDWGHRKGTRRKPHPIREHKKIPTHRKTMEHRLEKVDKNKKTVFRKPDEFGNEKPVMPRYNEVPLFPVHLARDEGEDEARKEKEAIGRRRMIQERPLTFREPTIWSIPFSYWFGSALSTKGQTVRQFWVHNETIRFVDAELYREQYILANPHWVFPYKINYDLDNWKMLIEQLIKNPNEIATMSRMQLLVDAETYLKQSGVPHLYVQILSYLEQESDLGVLLVGLDAIHSLIDMFSGSFVNGPLLVHLVPVIQHFDKMLEKTSTNPELAAVWLLSPLRLAKLYQLRCVANLGSCAQKEQVTQWLNYPTALDAEHHQQITAICHFLFTQAGSNEITFLMGLLKQKTTQWSVAIQLGTCVRDEILIDTVVEKIIKTRNAAVYSSVLQNGYSIQYNRKFRQIFWKVGLQRLQNLAEVTI
uniref:Aminopeptidase n=1 Tax=Acrobeloides nanus TaxID=290746 RepID=A0A914E1T3_9BILA